MKNFGAYEDLPPCATYLGSEDPGGMDEYLADLLAAANNPAFICDEQTGCKSFFELQPGPLSVHLSQTSCAM